MKTTKPFAVITGASQGLGKSFAFQLADKGYELILLAAPDDGLDLVSDHISKIFNITPVLFEGDLTDHDFLLAVSQKIAGHYKINLLINNAGMGAACCFGDEKPEFIEKMISLNITALTVLTHQLLPSLLGNTPAHILNVSSMIAFSPTGYKSVYPASKCYVRHFTTGLAEELKDRNVHVAALYPGTMRTNRFVTARIEKHNRLVRSGVVSTDIVAEVALRKLFAGKRHIVVGWSNHLMRLMMHVVPESLKTSMITRAMRREVETTTTATEISC